MFEHLFVIFIAPKLTSLYRFTLKLKVLTFPYYIDSFDTVFSVNCEKLLSLFVYLFYFITVK